MNDEFELSDLRVEVTGEPDLMVCGHTVGESFAVRGENLTFSATVSFDPVHPNRAPHGCDGLI